MGSDWDLRRGEDLGLGRPGLWVVALVVTVAAASRIPYLIADHVLGFDDGVYLASVQSMRMGYRPFADIFSSQGPLFLPILRFFDLLGGEAYWAPRVTIAVAAVALVGGSVAIVAKRGSAVTWTVGSVVALSGSVFLGTSSVEAEGVALVFGIAAFGVIALGTESGWRPLLAGLLLGVAISIKSLFVIPVALSVAWVIWRKYGLAHLVRSGTAGLLVVGASFLMWGVADVWEQYVAFHLQASEGLDPLRNANLLVARAWTWDKAALGTAFASALAWLWSRVRARSDASPMTEHPVDKEIVIGLAIWTALTLIVLLIHSPIFPRHSLFLLVPAILLVASSIHMPRWVALVAAAGVLIQVVTLAGLYPPKQGEVAAIDALRELPDDSFVVTDEPGIAYFASRAVPPNLVDPSFVRIEAGYLTVAEVESALYANQTCGLLFWSGRFNRLGIDPADIEGYESVESFGTRKQLLERATCRSS